MKIVSKILAASLIVALGACGKSTQQDVDQASSDRAASVAKAQQGAQPAVDAANRDLVKAQQDGNAKVADATTDANRGVDVAAAERAKEQAKADYNVAIAAAEGDLKVALEKCNMEAADAKVACERDAKSTRDQMVEAAKGKLDMANR